MSREEDGLFDSWKEIASYLGRDLRTVRRWEKTRALPVHRVPGGGRAAVYAYRSEIDTWLSETRDGDERDGEQSDNGAPPVESLTHSPESESDPTAGNSARVSHRRLTRYAVSIIIFGAVLGFSLTWIRRSEVGSATTASVTTGADPLEISSVSPILPQRDQSIVIRGRGFGLHTSYTNADSPFIAIRDNTLRWAAGRIIPQNWDEVTLSVKSWEDTQIVLSGFSGAYGSGDWKLNPGDQIEVAVWNPQSGRGPALYHLTVSGPPN